MENKKKNTFHIDSCKRVLHVAACAEQVRRVCLILPCLLEPFRLQLFRKTMYAQNKALPAPQKSLRNEAEPSSETAGQEESLQAVPASSPGLLPLREAREVAF